MLLITAASKHRVVIQIDKVCVIDFVLSVSYHLNVVAVLNLLEV